MTLLIPLLLRLTALFERGKRMDETLSEHHDVSEEKAAILSEKE